MMKTILMISFALIAFALAGIVPTSTHAPVTAIPNSRAGTLDLRAVSGTPDISCSGGGAIIKKTGSTPAGETASSTDTLSFDDCNHLANKAVELTGVADSMGYDTARAYLTLCYNQPNAYGLFFIARANVDGSWGNMTKYDDFREWLKSVLYLRLDTEWYCADVSEIVHTFVHYPGRGFYPNGMEAIIRYILDNNRCDSAQAVNFANGLNWPDVAYAWWRDTVKDSLTEPKPDTTVPSIDSIGLSILRGPQYAGIKETLPPPGTSEISGLSATEDPFTNTTAIKFNLADYGLVTFQLYALLGNAVTTNGIGQVLYPGEHEFDIDGSKLAAGTYIARVAFHDGDVESIMVVRK